MHSGKENKPPAELSMGKKQQHGLKAAVGSKPAVALGRSSKQLFLDLGQVCENIHLRVFAATPIPRVLQHMSCRFCSWVSISAVCLSCSSTGLYSCDTVLCNPQAHAAAALLLAAARLQRLQMCRVWHGVC
jgi:hypothetical protein